MKLIFNENMSFTLQSSIRTILEKALDNAPPAVDKDTSITFVREKGFDFCGQAYSINFRSEGGRSITVIQADGNAGFLYGAQDLAAYIRRHRTPEGCVITHKTPGIPKRGIKFNIPLDLRTPSYSDSSHAAQANIGDMWDSAFWEEYFTWMTRLRLNVLTLWNLHPFPSLIRVPEYPDVALDDVLRSKDFPYEGKSLTGTDMFTPEMLNDAEVILRITMDDKIKFWQRVMQRAYDLGIEVYIFTWNIFTYGTFGKYGITNAPDNQTTIDYFRCTMKAMLSAYPHLSGIGITSGEQLPQSEGPYSREHWPWLAYGEGISEALAATPDRPFTVIQRCHMADFDAFFSAWRNFPGNFQLSYKYAFAHLHTSTKPPFAEGLLEALPRGKKTWLTLRNDDIYSFQHGDYDFVKEFISQLPDTPPLVGFYLGPDGFCWGRDYMNRDELRNGRLILEKQWFSFMLWGRLGYDPELNSRFFDEQLAEAYPGLDGGTLRQALTAVGRIIPLLNGFFWRGPDFAWLPEACMSNPRNTDGFITIPVMLDNIPYPGTDNRNVLEYSRECIAGTIRGRSASQVGSEIRIQAEKALELIREMSGQEGSDTSRLSSAPTNNIAAVLHDIRCQASLGLYYAEKLTAVYHLGLFFFSRDGQDKRAAITFADRALKAWVRHANEYTAVYRPQFYNRVGFVDRQAMIAEAGRDVELVRDFDPDKWVKPVRRFNVIPAGRDR